MHQFKKFSRSPLVKLAMLSIASCAVFLPATAHSDTGKLLLTGGVSSVDGAAGGGLTPWAVIASLATQGEIGGTAHFTRVVTTDYALSTYGAALGWNERVELSLAKQDFKTGITGTLLGVPGLHLKQDIVGIKVRLAGDAVLDSDSLMPQIAAGMQFKSLGSTGLDATLSSLGTRRSGTDFYVNATKLFLAQGILINGTLRATKANQNGLLGFGATLGGARNSYDFLPEVSIAFLLRNNLAIGAEYRKMPNRLQVAGNAAGLGDGLKSSDWKDIFIAWAPSKNLSLTLAYVDLGQIVPATTAKRRQTGAYLSAQVAF
jgi:Protein of unknown function (DUF3034)